MPGNPAAPLRFHLVGAAAAPAVVPPAPAAQAAAPPTPVLPAEVVEEVLDERQAKLQAQAELQRSVDNSEGYFQPPLGFVIQHREESGEDSRYTIIGKAPLGVGVFSVVWPCADKANKLVALKVVRWQDHFRKYSEKEVHILQRVKELVDLDPEGAAQVAMLREHFVYRPDPSRNEEHLCMAFEKLESNLRTIGRQPIEKVLAFSKQLLLALRYLHEHVGLVHCDVKPDNLLLRWDGLAVKLCDFGTARLSPELQAVDELQPLYYRAPEIFVGATRGRKIDIWSAGLTIYELVVGRILLRSCNTHREVLEKVMQLRGAVPKEVRDQGRLTKLYFSDKGFHREVGAPVDPDTTYSAVPMLSELAPFADLGAKAGGLTAQEQAKAQLSRLIGRTTVVGAAMKRKAGPTEGEQKLQKLADLMGRMMDIDPAARITAASACEHEVLKAVELPPLVDLQEAPPLPQEAPPPLPPSS